MSIATAPSLLGQPGPAPWRLDETGPAETGTPGVGVAYVPRSNYQFIDGLLSGVKWGSLSIDYSFPDSTADYNAGYPAEPLTGFSGLNAAQMAAAHDMLNAANWNNAGPGHFGFSVEGLTNLDIFFAGPGTGTSTIRLGNNTDADTAYAYYPDTTVTGGDVWFGNSGEEPDRRQLRLPHRDPRDRPRPRPEARPRDRHPTARCRSTPTRWNTR